MDISVSPSVLIMVLIYALSGKISSLIIPLSAAMIHELGHIAFAFWFSIPIKKLRLNLFGALIETDQLNCSYGKEAIMSLAGPISNVICATLVYTLTNRELFISSRAIQYFFVSSLSFAFINLLPINSFDGGRFLSCLLLPKLSPEAVDKSLIWLSVLFAFIMWCCSVYLILKTGSSLSLFVFSGVLFSQIFSLGEYR